MLLGRDRRRFQNQVCNTHTPPMAPCGACAGCQTAADCGTCRECKDKPRFGGGGRRKRRCARRACTHSVSKELHRCAVVVLASWMRLKHFKVLSLEPNSDHFLVNVHHHNHQHRCSIFSKL